MPRNKQGTKAGRAERHQAAARAQKERKKLRQQRAELHRAMQEAARLKRSKKAGTRDFDENMRQLGYESRSIRQAGFEIHGDVLRKYREAS